MMRGGRRGRGRGRGRYQTKDYRRVKSLWYYENTKVSTGFDVSIIAPMIRTLIKEHRNQYYGDFSLEAVISDGKCSSKIDPIVLDDLNNENSITVTDLMIPDAKQVSDRYIRA